MEPLRYQSVRANGLEFNVAVAGSGDRLVLCLHGFPELSFAWRFQLPLFARLGYLAWAPDLRGYGRSSRLVGVQAYAIENLEADVAALIEASGATEVVLVGHDFGALVAWYYAMFGRLAISRLIVMNCPHPELAKRGMRRPRQILRSAYAYFFQLPFLPEWTLSRNGCAPIARAFKEMAIDKLRFPEDVLRVYRDAAAQPGALTAMLNYYRALARGFFRINRRGTRPIAVQTLMLWGEADAALGKELTVGTEQYVSDLTIRYLPRVSHWMQQEAPEVVNAMIGAWLLGREVPLAPGVEPAQN